MKLQKIYKPRLVGSDYSLRTKSQLIGHITRGAVYTFGGRGNLAFSGYVRDNTLILYNILKVRRNKAKQTPNHWIGYVYEFNLDFLNECGVKRAEQDIRTYHVRSYKY